MNYIDLSTIKRHLKFTIILFDLQLFLSFCLLIIYGLPLLNPFFLSIQVIGISLRVITKYIKVSTLLKSRLLLMSMVSIFILSTSTLTYLEYGVIPISSLNQFSRIEWNPSGHFRLEKDIIFDTNMDRNESCVIKDFDGKFDGNKHVITHLSVPLFCKISFDGVVKDLYLNDIELNFSRSISSGSITNYNEGLIESVHVSGSIQGKGNNGGLVGVNRGSIVRSSFTGVIHAENGQMIGGITSYNQGTIESTFAIGRIDAAIMVGGIAGYSDSGIIRNVYTDMDIEGLDRIGGIIGLESDSILSGLVVHGDLTAETNIGVISSRIYTYDYDILFTGYIHATEYVIEEDVLYLHDQEFLIPLSNQIELEDMDISFWTLILGLDLDKFRIDESYPKLIENIESK